MKRLLSTKTVLGISGLTARQIQYLSDQGYLKADRREKGCRREFSMAESAALVIAGQLQQRPDISNNAVLRIFPAVLNCCREIADRSLPVTQSQWLLIDWCDATAIRPGGLLALVTIAHERMHPVTILDAATAFKKLLASTNIPEIVPEQ